MANPRIYITEWATAAIDSNQRIIPAPNGQPTAQQSFDLTDRSQVCNPFQSYTTFIEISATAPYCIGFTDDDGKTIAEPTLHRIDGRLPYTIGVRSREQIAFILSEDAMAQFGPNADASIALAPSDSLKAAIDLFSNKDATEAAIARFEDAANRSSTAAANARQALSDLSAAQAGLQSRTDDVVRRETACVQNEHELVIAKQKNIDDAAMLDKTKSDFENEMQTARAAWVKEQTDTANVAAAKQAALDAQNAGTAGTLKARADALDAVKKQLDGLTPALVERETRIEAREAAVAAGEASLAATIKKLNDVGIHITIDQPA